MAKKLVKKDVEEDGKGIDKILDEEKKKIDVPPEAPKEAVKKSNKKGKKKEKKRKNPRSKKYIEAAGKIESSKKHNLEEAIKLVKTSSYSKFDGTLSLSVKLERSKKSDDSIRGTIRLPHGSGKSLKVEIATDEIIEKIKSGWTGFDALVASPAMMPKLAQVAKILGPKGKMPNPKDGTVVDDPKAALEDLRGKVTRYRADIGRNIHVPVGKVSWGDDKIAENVSTVLKALAHLKKESITLSATMGVGVKVETK